MRNAVVASVLIALLAVPASAHQEGKRLHLADAPADQQVEAIAYCDGVYRVMTKKDEPIEFREFDLRFKTDTGPDGPKPGTPVVLPAGMRGDRGFVIFASPEEMSDFIRSDC